jgi:hypothetical protein
VLLGACHAWERRRPVLCGALLAAAALLRYEAWVVIAAVAALWAAGPRRARDAASWWLPGAAVAAWCALHAWQTHEWFQFVRLNRAFVARSLPALALPWSTPRSLTASLARYVVDVPRESVGAWLLLAVPGAAWLLARGPRSLVASGAAVLGFITFAWVRRQHLGLDRHFVAVAPMYATAVAAGACALPAWALSRWRQLAQAATRGAALAVTTAVLAGITVPDVALARSIARGAWPSERRAAAVVRGLARERGLVFCDLTVVEVLSGLPPRAFVRWNVADVRVFNLAMAALDHGAAFAVSTPEHVRKLRGGARAFYESDGIVVLGRDARGP